MAAERRLLAWRMASLHCGGAAAERVVRLIEESHAPGELDGAGYWRHFHAELGHASASSLAGRFAPRREETDAAAISEVAAALRSLPWRQRQAFLLRVAVGVPTEVLPEALGLSPQDCRTALFDALGQLRARLDRSPQGDHRWVLSVRDWLQAPRAPDEPTFADTRASAPLAPSAGRTPRPVAATTATAAVSHRTPSKPAPMPAQIAATANSEAPSSPPGSTEAPAAAPPARQWLPWAFSALLAVAVLLVWMLAGGDTMQSPESGPSASAPVGKGSAIARGPAAPLSAPDYPLHAEAADVPLALLAELEFYLWLAAEEANDAEAD